MRVRFESIALEQPAELDWTFIASHDVEPRGTEFGSGYRPIAESTPDAPPPLGRPLKVKFPLKGKRQIEDAPTTLWLEAEVWWGGK